MIVLSSVNSIAAFSFLINNEVQLLGNDNILISFSEVKNAIIDKIILSHTDGVTIS